MIDILTVQQAAEKLQDAGLQITPDTLEAGIKQRVFPFGDYIDLGDAAPWCYIYRPQLKAWIEERDGYWE